MTSVPPVADQLATLAPRIASTADRVLFEEAVHAASSNALRLAYIGTWLSAAESLKRKFKDLAPRDHVAHQVAQKVDDMETRHQSIDAFVLERAKQYGFITDTEYAQLFHVYEMRCVYGHPYEQAPTPPALLAAATVAVDTVLSRTTKLRRGYIADQIKLLATDANFLDDVEATVVRYAGEVFPRVADDLHLDFLQRLWKEVAAFVGDPTKATLLRRSVWFTRGYLLEGGEGLIRPTDWVTILPAHAAVLAWALVDPAIFPLLPPHARDMVVGHVLGFARSDAGYFHHLERLDQDGNLTDRQRERMRDVADKINIAQLAAAGVSARWYIERVVAELKSHNWYQQNPAIDVVRNLGPAGIGVLSDDVQRVLGNNVLQCADGHARSAGKFLTALATADEQWPPRFIEGVVEECLVNERDEVRFKTHAATEAFASLRTVPPAEREAIVERLAARVRTGTWSLPTWMKVDREFESISDALDDLDPVIRELPAMKALRGALSEVQSQIAHADESASDVESQL